MAKILDGVSRTFGEFLLMPRLTEKNLSSDSIILAVNGSKFRRNRD